MTREEANKELYRVKQSFINTHTDTQLKKLENKHILDALDMAIETLSAIEDIKAEIEYYRDSFILANRHDIASVADNCLRFIDKHISGKENE